MFIHITYAVVRYSLVLWAAGLSGAAHSLIVALGLLLSRTNLIRFLHYVWFLPTFIGLVVALVGLFTNSSLTSFRERFKRIDIIIHPSS